MKLEDIIKYVEYVKYEVTNLTIVLSEKTIEITPAFVSEIILEHDYENLYTPMFSLSVSLSQEEYKQIVADKENVKFIVKIDKVYYNDEKTKLRTETFINDTFCSHIMDETPLMEQDLIDITKNVYKSSPDEKTPMDLEKTRDFWLFKDEHIKAGNTDVNMVIKSGTVNDILAQLMYQAGLKKVLMTPANNKKKIKNMMIPLMSTVKAIDYLQQIKGIYNKGVLFFMDFKHTYLIDKNAYCTAWVPNEYKITNIYIFSQKSQFNSIIGQYNDKDSKEANIFTNSESIDITNKSLINNAIYGNRMLLINPKSDKISSIEPELIQRGSSNTLVNIQKHTNSYLKNSDKIALIENEYSVKIILKDVDLESLTPNKCFKLIFQNTSLNEKYGGTYRISHVLTTFRKIGEELDSDTICELKKHNNKTNEFGGEDRFDDWNEYEEYDEYIDTDY